MLYILQNTRTSGRRTSFKYSWWWAPDARNMQSDSAEIKPAQCCIKLVFYLTYTTMHGNTKIKFCVYVCSLRYPARNAHAPSVVCPPPPPLITKLMWSKMCVDLHINYLYSCPIVMKLEFSGQIFKKIFKFHENNVQREPSCSMRMDGRKWRS